ncbi:hypothetical protein NECAME_15190 [Necator americanus]|uniref:Uncharacterized protein n=1 Tax=Necator americanus TaxID=51031 RepID=W2SLN0_NECAM|nr:hypothetical protein NECAME_15190 [Necator americanus]ETN69642.1 hypothetical protein NECAME_15190 [Necator americanus]
MRVERERQRGSGEEKATERARLRIDIREIRARLNEYATDCTEQRTLDVRCHLVDFFTDWVK